mmetsp:Transcript_10410/g.40654  ORF Transcript_10410/g.40654 Transcript_10410/m.40654 type:complete len:379 (-) Transcript_10410:170-1306(-)
MGVPDREASRGKSSGDGRARWSHLGPSMLAPRRGRGHDRLLYGPLVAHFALDPREPGCDRRRLRGLFAHLLLRREPRRRELDRLEPTLLPRRRVRRLMAPTPFLVRRRVAPVPDARHGSDVRELRRAASVALAPVQLVGPPRRGWRVRARSGPGAPVAPVAVVFLHGVGQVLLLLLLVRDHGEQLLAGHALKFFNLVRVLGDVQVGDDDATLCGRLVDRGAIVRARGELLRCEEPQVKLLAAHVDLSVPLARLLQQRDTPVLGGLRTVPTGFRPQGGHQLADGHLLKRFHLLGVIGYGVIRGRRRARLVDRGSVERASRLLLRVVVPEARRLASSGNLSAPLLRRAEQRHAAEFAALWRHCACRADPIAFGRIVLPAS